jgi:iron complex transport system ATP-binding protein
LLIADGISRTVRGKVLVDRISARFEPGRLNLVLGANGAGKSTLLKLLSGQLKPDAGVVRYGDHDLHTLSLARLATMRAVLSQSVEIAFPIRVWEVVMMGRYPHYIGRPSETDLAVCDELMQLFDVARMAERDYTTLSGGEQQRVHFARVLAQIWQPVAGHHRYLFLDEPLTFLDIYYQLEFMQRIQALRSMSDLVIVGVLHDLNLAARFADQVLLLHEGRLVASGPKEEVITRENIQRAFRVAPTIARHGDHIQLIFE